MIIDEQLNLKKSKESNYTTHIPLLPMRGNGLEGREVVSCSLGLVTRVADLTVVYTGQGYTDEHGTSIGKPAPSSAKTCNRHYDRRVVRR